MTITQPIVVSVFDDSTQAEQAVNELQNAGFSDDQIRFAGQGTSSGGILKSIKSLFTGEETGTAYADLVAMGVPQDDASYFQQEHEAGHPIVAVLADGRAQEATNIQARYGGYGANKHFTQTTDPESEQSLKLREEQLHAQKQSVQTGEVHLRKDVVTEQKSIDVPVMHEEVYIERRPGSGQPADQPIGEGETYRVPVREEQVAVEKQPVVREEIALGKRTVQETHQVSDTVRHEEARLERTGKANVYGSDIQEVSDQTDQATP